MLKFFVTYGKYYLVLTTKVAEFSLPTGLLYAHKWVFTTGLEASAGCEGNAVGVQIFRFGNVVQHGHV